MENSKCNEDLNTYYEDWKFAVSDLFFCTLCVDPRSSEHMERKAFSFFSTFRQSYTSKSGINIDCRSTKKKQTWQVWRAWLKWCSCHALDHFKLLKGMAGAFFEQHPPNLAKLFVFCRSTIDITITFGYMWLQLESNQTGQKRFYEAKCWFSRGHITTLDIIWVLFIEVN